MAEDGIVFDASDLDSLARDMQSAARKVRDEIDVTLLAIGTELTEAAKQIAGQHSSTVADTISMKPLPGMVVITAGADDVPIAALWEKGNKGTKDSARAQGVWFRHPVFGGDTWVQQRRFPFLRPALEADRREITKRMEATWDHALEPYRMKPQ